MFPQVHPSSPAFWSQMVVVVFGIIDDAPGTVRMEEIV
jgi:hypothetical protein